MTFKTFPFQFFSLLIFLIISPSVKAKVPSASTLSVQSCLNILTKNGSLEPKLKKRFYNIEFNESSGLEVLDIINKIFLEYNFIKSSEEATRIEIPVDEWVNHFDSNNPDTVMSFSNVVEELRKVSVQRVDLYSDKTEVIEVETSLVLSHQILRDSTGNSSSDKFIINLDPRVGKLFKLQLRELVSVFYQLKEGLLWVENANESI